MHAAIHTNYALSLRDADQYGESACARVGANGSKSIHNISYTLAEGAHTREIGITVQTTFGASALMCRLQSTPQSWQLWRDNPARLLVQSYALVVTFGQSFTLH
jgi:hypothetical protein